MNNHDIILCPNYKQKTQIALSPEKKALVGTMAKSSNLIFTPKDDDIIDDYDEETEDEEKYD